MKNIERQTIGIVGAGRFGSFLLKQLDQCTLLADLLYIYDTDRKALKANKAAHVAVSLGDIADSCDVIILAVPNRIFESTCKELAKYVNHNHIVIDVCSMKEFSTKIMKHTFDKDVQLIGTHPLFGPQSCKNLLSMQRADDLTKNFKIAVCNVSAKKKTFNCFVNVWLKEFLRLNVILCTPEEHDKQMAISQALTHFIGRTFERMGIDRVTMTTKSFDDLMDIIDLVKGGSSELFEDMQTMNSYALEARADFLEEAMDLHRELFEKSL